MSAELLDSDGIARLGWELVDELVDVAEHMSQLLDRHDRLQEAIVVLAGDVEAARGLDKAAGGRAVWEVLGLLAWRIEDTTGRSEWPDAATTLDELRRRVAEERRGRG